MKNLTRNKMQKTNGGYGIAKAKIDGFNPFHITTGDGIEFSVNSWESGDTGSSNEDF